jgi:hypothetical protein
VGAGGVVVVERKKVSVVCLTFLNARRGARKRSYRGTYGGKKKKRNESHVKKKKLCRMKPRKKSSMNTPHKEQSYFFLNCFSLSFV